MKKVHTTNKTKGLFGILATLALAIGIGVAIAPKEVVKTYAAASITLNNVGAGTSDSTSLKTTTVNNYVLNYVKGKEQKTGTELAMFLDKGSSSFVGNKTPIPGNITSVAFKTGSNASDTADYVVRFSGTEFTTSGSGGTAVVVKKATTYTFNNTNTSGNFFFAIAMGNAGKNGQIANIIINYEDAPAVPISVSGVTLNKTAVELYEGKTETLTATVAPGNADNKDVTWSSQNENIVTVNNGVLTAVSAGNTTVTVKTVDGDKTAVATVSVLANPVTKFTVDHSSVKKEYSLGEAFDEFAGLVVKEKRADGIESTISDYSISTVDTMELGKQIVRVEKGAFHDEFVVKVTNEGASVGVVQRFATDLFISEYVEGTSNNKYLEIYNGTGQTVNLSGYELQLFPNGATTANTNNKEIMSGTLEHNSTIVYKHSSANLTLPSGVTAIDSNAVSFNGDDVVVLVKNGVKIDVIGYIGQQKKWSVGDGAMAEYTLVRKLSVFEGFIPTKTEGNALENAEEWDVYAQNTVTHLGSHEFEGGSAAGGISYEDQAKAFARFVGRAAPAGKDGKGIQKLSLGPATQVAPTWEEIEEEKGAMDPESLEVFENSDDPEIAAGRGVYEELFEENDSAYADAKEFADWVMAQDGGDAQGMTNPTSCAEKFLDAWIMWEDLSEAAQDLIESHADFADAYARFLNWAIANDSLADISGNIGGGKTINTSNTSSVIATVIIGVMGLTTLAGLYFLRKKKEA